MGILSIHFMDGRHFSYSDELKIAREISIASWSLYNVRYIYIYIGGRRINFTRSSVESQIDYEIDTRKKKKKKGEKRREVRSRAGGEKTGVTDFRHIFLTGARVRQRKQQHLARHDTGQPFLLEIHHPPAFMI